jgi:twitching motility protein PilU
MDNQATAAAGPDAYPYLQQLYSLDDSDMVLSVGTPPQVKVAGVTRPIDSQPLRPGAAQHMAHQLQT